MTIMVEGDVTILEAGIGDSFNPRASWLAPDITLYLYLGRARFESHPGHRLSELKYLGRFFSLSRENVEIMPWIKQQPCPSTSFPIQHPLPSSESRLHSLK
jgi:hypothetical protein